MGQAGQRRTMSTNLGIYSHSEVAGCSSSQRPPFKDMSKDFGDMKAHIT